MGLIIRSELLAVDTTSQEFRFKLFMEFYFSHILNIQLDHHFNKSSGLFKIL